jgi:type IV secretory pathway VirB2 component (pilin)
MSDGQQTDERGASGTAPDAGDRRWIAGGWIGLLLMIGLAWANALPGGPVFDDHFLVANDACFGTWDGIQRTLSLTSSDVCAYRPMRYLSYGLDRLLFGDGFWGHHLGSVLNHMLAVLAAGLLAVLVRGSANADGQLRVDTRVLWFGLVVAAVWGLHPVQTDSVTYVSGRRDILAGLWTMVAVSGAIVARQRGGVWWLWPLWATLLGFLSKESAVVIPVVAGLWMLRGWSWRGMDWRRYAGVMGALVVGAGLAAALVVQRGVLDSFSQRGMFEWWGGTMESNFATVASLQVLYVRHGLGLAPLIGDYHAQTVPIWPNFWAWPPMAGVLLVLGMVALAVWSWRRLPLVSWGILYWLVGLGPVSHVIPHHELYAEHYLYIPLFGGVLAAVSLGEWLVDRAPDGRRAGWYARAVVGVVVVSSALLVASRNRDWRDERTFQESVHRQAPGNQRAAGNLIFIYGDAGEWVRMEPVCGQMKDRWLAGGMQGRRALSRCAEVALESGDLGGAWTYAQKLVENHPDIGRGWRLLSEVELRRGQCESGWLATGRWWELTRATGAVAAMGAYMAQCGGSAEQAEQLVDRAFATPGLPQELKLELARMLRERGHEARAMMLERETVNPDAEDGSGG